MQFLYNSESQFCNSNKIQIVINEWGILICILVKLCSNCILKYQQITYFPKMELFLK